MLADDYAVRKGSIYAVEETGGEDEDGEGENREASRMIRNGRYCYPELRFIRRRP